MYFFLLKLLYYMICKVNFEGRDHILPFHQLEDFSQFFLIGAERGALLDFGV